MADWHEVHVEQPTKPHYKYCAKTGRVREVTRTVADEQTVRDAYGL
jgi:hypothetical protein